MNVHIQWKGTDVCMDLHCICGAHSHFDGYFAYYVKCPSCDAVYELGTKVETIRDHSKEHLNDAVLPELIA